MKLRTGAFRIVISIAMLAALCAFVVDPSQKLDTDFIVTAAPAYEPLAALHGQERFPKGAQLLLVHEGKAEPLVTDFAATADANVFFDGSKVLFAGKKAAADPWQIWEVTLKDRSTRQLTAGSADAIRPLYLPGDQFVFALRTAHGFQLQSAVIGDATTQSGSVGSQSVPLTFVDTNSIPSDVLADGRILFESGFPLGSGSTPELFLVYSDGSGVESYRCDHGSGRWAGKQLSNGDIVFTHRASLARFTSALANEERIIAPRAEYAGAIAEMRTGVWLVSVSGNAAKGEHYAIESWKPGASSLVPVLARSGEDLIDPVLVTPRTMPKRHPSALHPWDYSNLLALDARLSRDGVLPSPPASVRLETEDASGHAVALGTAPIEQDGSFFVKAPGDKPIRFAVLDAKGAVLRQERGWFWARGGEQRYCVGCHAGPERAPENKVPTVLLRSTTPPDLTVPVQASAAQSADQGGHAR